MISIKNVIASLIALALIIVAGSSVAAQPDHAKRNPPQKFYWIDELGEPVPQTSEFLPCDGFDTLLTVTFQGFWMSHPGTPGKDQWEFYHSAWPSKISRADDPSIFVEGKPGGKINRHWTAEPFASDFIETGVQILVTLPGYGVVFRDVGRIRVNWGTFDVEFIAGNWDSHDEDYQALCAALTP